MGTVEIAVQYIVAIVTAVGGVISCYAGFRCFKAVLTIAGGVSGFALGELLFDEFGGVLNVPNPTFVGVMVGLAFGLVFALLAYKFYEKALIAVVALAVCYVFAQSWLAVYPGDYFKAIGIGIGVGLIFGLAVKFIQKWVIILLTSFLGAKMIAQIVVPLLMYIPGIEKFSSVVTGFILPGSVVAAEAGITALLVVILFASGFTVQAKRG